MILVRFLDLKFLRERAASLNSNFKSTAVVGRIAPHSQLAARRDFIVGCAAPSITLPGELAKAREDAMTTQETSGRPTRREVVTGAVALGLASTWPTPLFAQDHVRRSVTGRDADPAMLAAYKRAVRAMLQLPPSDPRNWYRQAVVHVIDCPHHNWWFLPWHRGYLYHFEQICRKLSGVETFALPFWDWTATPRVPDAMFEDVLTPTDSAYLASFDA